MRFGLTITIVLTLALQISAAAKPWDIVRVDNETLATSPAATSVQISKGGAVNNLAAIDALTLTPYVKGLGTISALAAAGEGRLYAADRNSGRIWELVDREQDGKLDQRSAMAAQFNAPTGLAVIGETLYVADKDAVWSLAPSSPPQRLAALSHVPHDGEPILIADGQDLLLALNSDSKARVIAIDTSSGFASDVLELAAPIHSLATREGTEAWAGLDGGINKISLNAKSINLGPSSAIVSLLLPGQYDVPVQWPSLLKDHIIAGQTGAGAMRLIAIPTQFGQPSGPARVLVDGFLSSTGRNAWGAPGAMVSDSRGLFFADPHNGTIWRLAPRPPKPIKITIVDTKDVIAPQAPAPLAAQDSGLLIGSGITGSQIGAASQISSATQLTVGSTLVQAYEKAQAEKEAEEAAAEAAKKLKAKPPEINLKPHLE